MKLQDLREKIEAENDLFNNMTPAEKRVVVAQDCLVRIHMNQISIKSGTFLCGIDGNPFYHTENLSDKSIRDEINSDETFSCRACAKGSLFMSYVGRVNEVIFAEVKDNNSINDDDHKKLLEIFSAEQLALIEMVFEGRQFIHHTKNKRNELGAFIKGDEITFSYEIKDKIDEIRKNNSTAEQRIEYICNNIIENKGDFIL